MLSSNQPVSLLSVDNQRLSRGPATSLAAVDANNVNERSRECLLTTPFAATYLAVSAATLERWRQTGEGPLSIRLSAKAVRYRKSDLDRFIADRCVSSTSEPTEAE